MKKIVFTFLFFTIQSLSAMHGDNARLSSNKRYKASAGKNIGQTFPDESLINHAVEQIIVTNHEFVNAATNGDFESTQYYLEWFKSLDREKALARATRAGFLEIVELILQHGAAVNKQNEYGTSALMIAAYYGNLEMCRLLLNYGAKVHLQDNNRLKAFDWARAGKKKLLIEALDLALDNYDHEAVIALLHEASN